MAATGAETVMRFLLRCIPAEWAVARVALPGTTANLVRGFTRSLNTEAEDRRLANHLNAYANMIVAHRSHKARAEQSSDEAVIQARDRLAKAFKHDREGQVAE